MKCTVFGKQHVDFVPDDGGAAIKGVKLHMLANPTDFDISNGYEGQRYEKIFGRVGTEMYNKLVSLQVGVEYDFKYSVDGKRAFLSDVVPVAK